MFPRDTVNFWDDFCGAYYRDWVYQAVYSASGGVYTTAEGDDDDLSGSLQLLADASGYGEATLLDCAPWRRDYKPTLRARFRLSHTTNVAARIGFENAINNNYIALNARSADGDFRFTVKSAGTVTQNVAFPVPVALDTSWHTVELRLLGAGAGGELVLDGDEANKATLASGALITLPFALFGRCEDTGGGARNLYIDWWSVSQARYT